MRAKNVNTASFLYLHHNEFINVADNEPTGLARAQLIGRERR
ncbi:hypothetical protein PVT68_08795 [Microbulbifer bruguierae]|uniref:Uncharacterized protein n=1 Tax=Microbulbifer bruguierae TaxID=3029061 RepID=A0ABY8NIW3_9GAMM|nr:hypothetical protein [Microbulbifer bruguierae]WGL18379.1 hypothetical protein PVT68_08795 [Microbulbifer bruguierae]